MSKFIQFTQGSDRRKTAVNADNIEGICEISDGRARISTMKDDECFVSNEGYDEILKQLEAQ